MKNTDSTIIVFEIDNLKIKVMLYNGFFDFEITPDHPIHSHADFELHFVLEGTVEFKVENENVFLNKNDILLIPKNTIHERIREGKNTAVSSLSFSITKAKKNCNADSYGLINELLENTNTIMVFKQKITLIRYLRKIISEFYEKKMFRQDKIKSLFILLFSELFEVLLKVKHRPSFPREIESVTSEYDIRIAMIEEYFNSHYMMDITVTDLAKSLYLGEKQTNRIIQKAYNSSFKTQLIKHRIKIAKDLLINSNHSVKSIAEMVGYQSYNGFYYLFKKHTNMTPEEFRMKQTERL